MIPQKTLQVYSGSLLPIPQSRKSVPKAAKFRPYFLSFSLSTSISLLNSRAVNRVRHLFQNKCIPKNLGGGLHFSRSYSIRLSQDGIPMLCFHQFTE